MLNFNINNIIKQSDIQQRLEIFMQLLIKWAKIHNITSSKDLDSIKSQIEDSLIPISFLNPFKTCIDIGSGAGFPALILACYYTNSKFYLLEPRAKRVAFLEYAVIKMGLSNIEIIQDFSYNIKNIKAELITSRAVCKSNKLIKDSTHLMLPNGYYLLFKGSNAKEEIKELKNFKIDIFNNKQRVYVYVKP